MLHHYMIGIGAFVLLSAAWVGVQRAWRRSFPSAGDDPDVLAGRAGCNGCDDNSKQCHRKLASGSCKVQEEIR
jgi:hypothetical protein